MEVTIRGKKKGLRERERERKGERGRRERKEERYICDKGAGGGLIEEG